MGPRSVGATEKKIIEEEKEKEMRRASERPFHATPQHKYHHHLPHPHQAQSSREREKGSIDARALRLDSFVAGESVPFAPPAMVYPSGLISSRSSHLVHSRTVSVCPPAGS